MSLCKARIRLYGINSSQCPEITHLKRKSEEIGRITCNRCHNPQFVPYTQLKMLEMGLLQGDLTVFICPECEMLSISYTNEFNNPRLYLFYLAPE